MTEITIVGAGVAGSYLYSLLRDEYNILIYDPAKRRGCTCAWGCFYTLLKEKLDKVDLNVEDYILCKNRGLVLNGAYIPLRNQISIDKPKLVKDLCPKPIPKKVDLSLDNAFGPELIVNATGVPLCPHYIIPTVQYRVKAEGLEPQVNYVYVNPKYVGYAWVFSLDEEGKWFHLGAGCVNAAPEILVKALVKRYKVKVTAKSCMCNRPIRVVNPEELRIYLGRIISVGEAAGLVFPVTGEGILPAMVSSLALRNVMLSLKTDPWIGIREEYESLIKVYMILHDYYKAFEVWKLMKKHPRTAWLKGFRFMLKRTKTRAQPVLTPLNLLKVITRLICGR